MPVSQLNIDHKGLQRVMAGFEKFKTNASDLTRPMNSAGKIMLKSIKNNFDSVGRPKRWPALKPSTGKQKLREGYTIQPLVRTGALMRSMTYRVSGNGKLLSVGTSIPYGSIHQFGGTIKRGAHSRVVPFSKKGGFLSKKSASRRKTGFISIRRVSFGASSVNIPARPFLLFQDEDIDQMNSLIAEHLLSAYNKGI